MLHYPCGSLNGRYDNAATSDELTAASVGLNFTLLQPFTFFFLIDHTDSQRCHHYYQRENGSADSQCHPGLHEYREGILCWKRTVLLSCCFFTFIKRIIRMNNYRTSLYISVLLHFPLGKRENLPGGFPHVAKHVDGQGKALLHLPAVTIHSTVS